MLLDLKFSIGTLGIGSGAFIAALYGMNLKNFIEESDLGFLGVTVWSMVFAGVICAYGLTKLRKVQRVSMWGESGKKGSKGSWRQTDEESQASAILQNAKKMRLARLKDPKGNTMADVIGNVRPQPPALVKIKAGNGKKL